MALITCPNCEKQVSDTNGKCFHCGYDFIKQKEEPQKAQEYYALSERERSHLITEFYEQYPRCDIFMQKYTKFLKRMRIISTLATLTGILLLLVLISGQLYHGLTKKDVPFAVVYPIAALGAIWFISVIFSLVFRFAIYKKYRRKELVINKKLQKWFKEEKNIIYKFPFTAKQKKDKAFFDSIDADKDDIEV